MKKFVLKILVIAGVLAVAVAFVRPARAIFFEKAQVEKRLEKKIEERDSLQNVLNALRENPDNLEKIVRNSGYSRKNETMLKIIVTDSEKEERKTEINLFLAVAGALVVFLIVMFALPTEKKDKICPPSPQNTPE